MDPSTSAAAPSAPAAAEGDESGSGDDESDEGHTPARRALKCRLCNGTLILNPVALRQHVASKKHLKRCKGGFGSCFAFKCGLHRKCDLHRILHIFHAPCLQH